MITSLLAPITNYFNISSDFISGTFNGLLEITNGINTISNIPCKKISINILITSFLLGISGLSILFQILSITAKSDLSIKPYIYGKLLQAILSTIYTYMFITTLPFFNFDLI